MSRGGVAGAPGVAAAWQESQESWQMGQRQAGERQAVVR